VLELSFHRTVIKVFCINRGPSNFLILFI